jgi:hypothetical protein
MPDLPPRDKGSSFEQIPPVSLNADGSRSNHPNATPSLLMGLLSVVFCCILFGPIAWIGSNKALREIDANPTVWTGRGIATAGKAIGIVMTSLWVLFWLTFVVLNVVELARGLRAW